MSRTLRIKGESQYGNSSLWSWHFIQDDDLDENGLVNCRWERKVFGLTKSAANKVKRAIFHSDGQPWGTRGPGTAYRRQLRAILRNELRSQLAALPIDEYDGIIMSPHCNNWSWW